MTILATAAFDFGNDDVANVTWRFVRRSPALRARLWRGIAMAAVLAGLTLPVLLLATRQAPPSQPVLLVAGVVAAVAAGALFAVRVPARYRRSVRNLLQRRHGAGPHRCVVELHAEHALVRQFDSERRLPWAELALLHDDGADIEIRTRQGIVVVRGRAFADAAARAHFLATARRLARGNG